MSKMDTCGNVNTSEHCRKAPRSCDLGHVWLSPTWISLTYILNEYHILFVFCLGCFLGVFFFVCLGFFCIFCSTLWLWVCAWEKCHIIYSYCVIGAKIVKLNLYLQSLVFLTSKKKLKICPTTLSAWAPKFPPSQKTYYFDTLENVTRPKIYSMQWNHQVSGFVLVFRHDPSGFYINFPYEEKRKAPVQTNDAF